MSRRLAPSVGAGALAAVFVGLAAVRSAWSASSEAAQSSGTPAAPSSGGGPVPWPTVEAPGTPTSVAPARAEPVAPGSVAPPPPPSRGPQAGDQKPGDQKPGDQKPGEAASSPPAAPVASTRAGAETSFGGYGEAALQMNRNRDVDARLPWVALTFRHRPTGWLQLSAAAELEEASRFGVEWLELQAVAHPAFGVRAGLILLPIGIVNLWHDPTTFLTVDRPLIDRLIIPTTWRELGGGIFGSLGDGARYEIDVVAGLDAAGFSAAAPLWGGRGNGRSLGAHDAALVGRIELGRALSGLTVGGSGYWGGASGGQPRLQGVTVSLFEVDARFRGGGFDLRAEAAEFLIVNSYRVNDYLGLLGQDAVPSGGRGLYAQAAYDVFASAAPPTRQQLLFFAGFENVNPRSRISPYNYNPPTITGPGGAAPDAPSSGKSFIRGGVCYRPVAAVAVKVDVQVALDSEGAPPRPPLTVAGAPAAPKALPGYVADAARGQTLVSAAAAFSF